MDQGARRTESRSGPRQPWLHELLIAVDGHVTALGGADGDLAATGAHGLLVDDARVLSLLTLTVGGEQPTPVGAAASGAVAEFLGSARGLGDEGADPTVEVRRRRTLAAGRLHERVEVASRAHVPVRATLELRLGGDGAELAEVKQGVATGVPVPVRVAGESLAWDLPRHTVTARLAAGRGDLSVADGVGVVTSSVDVAPGEAVALEVVVEAARRGPSRFDAETGSSAVDWTGTVSVEARDERFTALVRASVEDLQHLLLDDPEDRRDVFCAAGTPWYLTLFGRDSLWSARLALPLGTALAGGTLRALARRQGRADDPVSAEAPGKIPHELRRTDYVDKTHGMHLPAVYYGTVDATALWVCLLHDAWRWGLPEAEVRDLLPSLRSALHWLTEVAPGEDGLLKYVDEAGTGLANQGWKDSGDSMRWRDGRVAEAPIALVEAQAYAVEAARGAAHLLDALGAGEEGESERLRAYADALAGRIRDRYWVAEGDRRYLAMAVDGHGEAITGVGSNMGHVLGTGALTAEEVERVAATLMGPTMLLRGGIATMATDNGGFNPLGYHTGSVWTHDTAICALGLALEGRVEDAAEVARRLVATGASFDDRFPELFADEGVLGRPVPYPASCRPQAWAAASAVALVRIALGLDVDVPGRTVTVRPPASLPFGELRATGLRVGEAVLTVHVSADGAVAVDGLPEGFTLVTP